MRVGARHTTSGWKRGKGGEWHIVSKRLDLDHSTCGGRGILTLDIRRGQVVQECHCPSSCYSSTRNAGGSGNSVDEQNKETIQSLQTADKRDDLILYEISKGLSLATFH